MIGTVPFDRVQVTVFDRLTNALLFEGELPLGFFDEAGCRKATTASSSRCRRATRSRRRASSSTRSVARRSIRNVMVPAVPLTISLQLSPNVLWPANSKLVTITATIEASSPLGHATAVALVSITGSESGAADDIERRVTWD